MTRQLNRALDKFQTEAAQKRDRREREKELNDLRLLIGMKEFRRFMDRFLTRARCFATVYAPGEQIYFNSGWQDSGFYVMSELEAASPEGLMLLLKERMSDKQRAALELIEEGEGLRKAAAERGEETDD